MTTAPISNLAATYYSLDISLTTSFEYFNFSNV